MYIVNPTPSPPTSTQEKMLNHDYAKFDRGWGGGAVGGGGVNKVH